MAQNPPNQAAWMPAPKVIPLEIGPAAYTAPGPGQLVVRNAAVGINPVDWVKQMLGDVMLGHVKYPAVLGEDVAGTVVAVGEGVERFREGDRVLAVASAIVSNNAAEGGFQHYTLVREWFTVPLPDRVSFEEGCVLPLALLTSSTGLFSPAHLGLDLPTVPARATTAADGKTTRVVIIAGGASCVGGTAVQLAVSAGYEVVSTSSPANFDHVKKLGASYVFDYKSMTLGEDLIDAVAGRQLCGCFSIGDGTADIFADVLTRHAGPAPTVKRIARAEGKHSVAEDSGILVGFIINGIGAEDPTRPVFEDFLPGALASGQFVPAPKAVVVGTGLDKLQEAFTRLKQGVSAQKMVVRLPAGDGAS